MDKLTFDGLTVNEARHYDPLGYYIFPKTMWHLGQWIEPLGKRAENDSLTFRLFTEETPDLSFFKQEKAYRWDCWLSDKSSKEGKIVVSFFQTYGRKYFDVNLASLPRFFYGRSSKVFSILDNKGLKDRLTALHRFKDLINKKLPVFGKSEWFDPIECQIPRADNFVDLRFESEGKRDSYFNRARLLRFDHLPDKPFVYEATETTGSSLIWTNCDRLENSTIFLKLYVKKNFDKNRKSGEELNKTKLRLEVSRQKKACFDPLPQIFGKDLYLKDKGLTVENLMKQSVINRLFLTVAAPFFIGAHYY